MAFLLLFSSMGFTFYGHECKITHKKEISLHSIKACCGENDNSADNQLTFKKFACCKLTKEVKKVDTHQKVDVSNSSLKANLSPIQPLAFTFSPKIIVISDNFLHLVFKANAPPSTTLERLARLQIYRL